MFIQGLTAICTDEGAIRATRITGAGSPSTWRNGARRGVADTTTPGRFDRIRSIHPGWILVVLDIVGLAIASYLAVVEVGGGVPACGPLHGCETVARSQYAWIGPIPVAVFGVALSLILLAAALGWWRTGDRRLLAVHYGLSLLGVTFEAEQANIEHARRAQVGLDDGVGLDDRDLVRDGARVAMITPPICSPYQIADDPANEATD